MSSLEKKIDEAEKKCEETSRISEERLKKAVEAESKITIMHSSMQRCLKLLALTFQKFTFFSQYSGIISSVPYFETLRCDQPFTAICISFSNLEFGISF